MKAIAHFTSAVAAATFIPGVVALAGHERSLILVLAGIFGLLPDWLDFKIARYFEPVDERIEPPALNFNAQAVADQLAEIIHQAYESEKPVTVQFYPARLGIDRWRRYSLQFDSDHNQVLLVYPDRTESLPLASKYELSLQLVDAIVALRKLMDES